MAKSGVFDRVNQVITEIDSVRIEEVFRLGALRDGVQLLTTEIRLPILGQVIPRIEIDLTGPGFHKKVTVRINQLSPFLFDGCSLVASLNGQRYEVAASQFVDSDRAPTGMYNFGLLRENGTRSFVFDYHTYCVYSCAFCFKESEWEVLGVQGGGTQNYKANFDECLAYVDEHGSKFDEKYDIVWLCTGSIKSESVELERHTLLAGRLRERGYTHGIYVSQVIPQGIVHDQALRVRYLQSLKESGISRFNSGVEVVGLERRRELIQGYKADIRFEDYVNIFRDAVQVFGANSVGSCLLAGVEPADDTIGGLRTIAELGVVPSPTVFTAFVTKQLAIPFQYGLDDLIRVHCEFNSIIREYDLPVFSGVFSLA